ncbi:ImuA family protein [Neomesorhizobium albiziae]|uniref:ImuA family protein n=1 Tax=Neomesorhizobium albiziae TaxID=335020 RepID=UPI00313D7C85
MAQAAVFALRRKIAKIEGTLPEKLVAAGVAILHPSGSAWAEAGASGFLHTGVARLDNVLGGGVPAAALTEIHGGEMRDAGAVTGFALALASLSRNREPDREKRFLVLWIGMSQAFAETGFPHAPGLGALTGLAPDEIIIAQAPKLTDALWIAEEAARLRELSAVFLEIHGNPVRLDLTATRRLHRRAQLAGRPVFLLRQAARAEPTAAPLRLVVSPAPATARSTLTGPLADTIGCPAFTVTVSKSRTALPGQFILEWNPHERAFQERQPENSRPVVSAPAVRPDISPAAGAVVAFKSARPAAAVAHQPSRQQHPAHRGARRTG